MQACRKNTLYSPRTTASVDSQSVDTTSGGSSSRPGQRQGRRRAQRHIVFDSMGLLLAAGIRSVNPCAG